MQGLPPIPQWSMLGWLQLAPSQQPPGQVLAEQAVVTQEACWQLAPLSVQSAQLTPEAPQALSRSPGLQVPAAQQPGQVDSHAVAPTQVPLALQTCPGPQSLQVTPFRPHAESTGGVRQAPAWQQPSGQLVASQGICLHWPPTQLQPAAHAAQAPPPTPHRSRVGLEMHSVSLAQQPEHVSAPQLPTVSLQVPLVHAAGGVQPAQAAPPEPQTRSLCSAGSTQPALPQQPLEQVWTLH